MWKILSYSVLVLLIDYENAEEWPQKGDAESC